MPLDPARTGVARRSLSVPPRGRNSRPVKPRHPLFRNPVQVLLVVACLGLLGGGLVTRVRNPVPAVDSRIATARGNLKTLGIALEMLHEDSGRLPSMREGLVSLVHDPGIPGWDGPYILDLKPDPWGHFFLYRIHSTNEFSLSSPGPDGKTGTGDDIHRFKKVPRSRDG